MATDWTTIASLATAGGTLILAVSTFSAVRSANRAARVAERALLVGVRPLLVPSRLSDGVQKIYYADGKRVAVPGGMAAAEVEGDVVYLAISVRNAGRGIGVVHGWQVQVGSITANTAPDPAAFRPQGLDLYIPPSDMGYWEGAFRDPSEPLRADAAKAIAAGDQLLIDVLYGDHEGGQRAISRFLLRRTDVQPADGAATQPRWLTSVIRHWSLDAPAPRERPDPPDAIGPR